MIRPAWINDGERPSEQTGWTETDSFEFVDGLTVEAPGGVA